METYNNFEVQYKIKESVKNDNLVINAPDASYCMFSLDYILGEGYSRFKKWLFKRGILGWRHTFDCDNYAEAFRVFLHTIHSKAMVKEKNTQSKQSVAFGVIWYTRDKGGGHAINILISEKDGLNKVLFLEPQNGQLVELSDKEKQSINFCLI